MLVRRLWPGSRGDENAEAGAIVGVRSSIAVSMVLAGDAPPVFARRAAVQRTLVETTRAALRNDAAIHALLTGAPPMRSTMPAGGWYAAPEALPFESRDRKAELLAHHCRRRWYQLLVRFFDSLRGGQTAAHGQLSCGLTIDVPPEIWDATNAVIDLITGAVASDQRPSFDRIDVEPQAAELSQRVLSQASCM